MLLRYLFSKTSLNIPVQLQDFITLSLSVLIEATPFVFLGIVLSLLVRHAIPEKIFYKMMPQNNLIRRLYLSILGIFLPVCECGNIPLARGLMIKGLKPSEVVTFLLGAPILNPITITTTIIAFGGDFRIIIARIAGGLLISNIVGWVFSTYKNQDLLLTKEFSAYCDNHSDRHHKKDELINNFKEEAQTMMIPLVLGSMVAGATQVLVPRSILTAIGGHVVYSVIAMIVLAFVVSICASVDAFFALAYVNQFTPGSLVSFLVFGPMIDIKLLSLLRSTFNKKTLIYMTLIVFILSTALGLGVNYAF